MWQMIAKIVCIDLIEQYYANIVIFIDIYSYHQGEFGVGM